MSNGLNKQSQSKTISVVVAAVIVVLALGFVYFLFHGSYAKPSYSLSGDSLTISGQFGVKIDLSGATVAHETSQVPATETKTNGAAIGKIEKGYFKINGLEVYLNVMDDSASNYILITDKNGSKYYINCETPDGTNNLYNEISERK